jgi:sterol desaturase/sphingolipid hydroxylase (fatty acid hydroxylase superfamily)
MQMGFVSEIGEATIRLAAFSVILSGMALYELWAPRRDLVAGRGRRWITNALIVVIDSVAVRIVFPLATIGAALWADAQGFGLMNQLGNSLLWSGVVAGVLGYLFLDVIIWGQHVLSHKIPLFWRFHRMHHADVDIDVTTALRFHPIEILASMALKMAAVALLGIPPLAAFIFEVVLNGMAMFNHANVRIPDRIERVLRWFIVTPDMHRVHHSVHRNETDSNYGFSLSWWDRLFATYVAQPRDGHTGMVIGLPEYQSEAPTRLGWSLWLPFTTLRPERPAKDDPKIKRTVHQNPAE